MGNSWCLRWILLLWSMVTRPRWIGFCVSTPSWKKKLWGKWVSELSWLVRRFLRITDNHKSWAKYHAISCFMKDSPNLLFLNMSSSSSSSPPPPPPSSLLLLFCIFLLQKQSKTLQVSLNWSSPKKNLFRSFCFEQSASHQGSEFGSLDDLHGPGGRGDFNAFTEESFPDGKGCDVSFATFSEVGCSGGDVWTRFFEDVEAVFFFLFVKPFLEFFGYVEYLRGLGICLSVFLVRTCYTASIKCLVISQLFYHGQWTT